MKVYIIEPESNKEIVEYLNFKHKVMPLNKIYLADVIIVNKVCNIKLGLDIVDYALAQGKEIICIKNKFGKEYYVTNYLIKNGAMYV